MKDYISQVDGVLKLLQAKRPLTVVPYRLGDIRDAIIARSAVDQIDFFEFPAQSDAIIGKIEIYTHSPGVYSLPVTRAEIYYANTLNLCWRRLVICKEMCQLFWHDDQTTHVKDEDQLIALVEALTLPEISRQILGSHLQFAAEQYALAASLEILFPFELRAKLMKQYEAKEVTALGIATRFRIPEKYIFLMMNRQYHDVIERMKKQRLGIA